MQRIERNEARFRESDKSEKRSDAPNFANRESSNYNTLTPAREPNFKSQINRDNSGKFSESLKNPE